MHVISYCLDLSLLDYRTHIAIILDQYINSSSSSWVRKALKTGMGQQQSQIKKAIPLSFSKKMSKRNPHLLESIPFVPELFSGEADLQIRKIDKLTSSIQITPFYHFLVASIDQRFVWSPNQSASIKQPAIYYELQTFDRFKQLLDKLQRWYHIQNDMNKIYDQQSGRRMTIRKLIDPCFSSQQDVKMFSKLFLHYYLLIFKKSVSSKNQSVGTLIMEFHKRIGVLICKMIECNHLSRSKLMELAYKSIMVEKSCEGTLERVLKEIKDEFQPIYLRKQHSIGVSPSERERIRRISRCYLDQLYLRSIKEAEDPDIKDQDESIGLMQSFPILHVKDKYK